MIAMNKLAISLAAMVVMGVVGPAAAQPAQEKPFRIVASFYPMYVAVLNVAGGVPGVEIECLTEPFVGCLHDYQLSARDMKRLARADVLVANGAGMESFLGKALKNFPDLKVVEASRGVRLVDNGNPHVWVGISGAIRQVDAIARGLGEADPPRAAAYRANAARYRKKLEDLRAEMRQRLRGARGKEIITFHEAFPYFAEEFGLKIAGVVEREPGSEPNSKELRETIELIRARGVRALFAEPQYPSRSAEIIARETGLKVRMLDPVATGPMAPEQARDAYLVAMRRNAEVLAEALAD